MRPSKRPSTGFGAIPRVDSGVRAVVVTGERGAGYVLVGGRGFEPPASCSRSTDGQARSRVSAVACVASVACVAGDDSSLQLCPLGGTVGNGAADPSRDRPRWYHPAMATDVLLD